ncbi:MAG: hypothetical protein K6G37_01010 [Bacilli bacterium]|nr:hypothetical protein [Bacilli bacterium]
MESLKKYIKYVGIAGCLLSIIGLFLVFAGVYMKDGKYIDGTSIKFIEGDGKIVLVAMLVSAGLIFFKKYKTSYITSAVALIVTLYDGIDVKNILPSYRFLDIRLGIGFYVTLIAIIITFAATFIADKYKDVK